MPRINSGKAETHTFAALDGIRGVLALGVAYMHFPAILYFPGTLKFNSGLCVDFFFLLSGFVIAYTTRAGLGTRAHVLRFMLRRIGRLWPLHIATLAILLLCKLESTFVIWLTHSSHAIPFQEASYLPYTLLTNILMLHGLDPNGYSWNYPSWSISVEFWVYAIFALFMWQAGRGKEFFAFTLVIMAIILQWLLTGVTEAAFLNGFLRCIAGFFTGFLIYRHFTRSQSINTPIEVLMGALIVTFIGLTTNAYIAALAPIVFSAPLWVFACQRGAVSKLLESNPLQKLGQWSFGIYLVHMPVIEISNHWWVLAQKGIMKAYGSQCAVGYANAKTASPEMCGAADIAVLIAVTGLYFLVVLKCAQLLYKHVEAPARRKFNAYADTIPHTSNSWL